MRQHNFSAGPAVLPEPVLIDAAEAIWELGDAGVGLLECSHRSAAFDEVIDDATSRLRRLMALDEDQELLFLHGGARTQFFMIPMNLMGPSRPGSRATYLDTGIWSAGAVTEARRFGTIDVPWSSAESKYDRVPAPGEWGDLPDNTRYLHYTSNNTVAGTQYHHVPEVGDAWRVCDASSDFLCRPMDGSKFDLLYGGAQKNLGPSGVTLVVIRRSLLDQCDLNLPMMLRYGVHVEKGSRYNTPCTMAIWAVGRVARWIDDSGGLDVIGERNRAQAASLYKVIDGSDFWIGKVKADSRSLMNVTFTTGSVDQDARFVSQAADAGMVGLKGHKSVGGLRASIYNAQTDKAVGELCSFMNDFERRNG